MLCLKSRAHCKYLKRESSCQILHFRNGVARAGSKLCGPAIFPSPVRRMRLAWRWSLFVRGAWIPHCACFFPSLFIQSGPAHHGPGRWGYGPFPLGSSARSPTHSGVVTVTSNEHFCRVMFSRIRFLHYTSCGPPWHLIQAKIITSEEGYERDLPLKAFLW